MSQKWSDTEFLDYMYWHCRTELGEFHKDHVKRLISLARRVDPIPNLTEMLSRADARQFWQLGESFVDPLVASARRALVLSEGAQT